MIKLTVKWGKYFYVKEDPTMAAWRPKKNMSKGPEAWPSRNGPD